jgi:site-specific recombinase XerD
VEDWKLIGQALFDYSKLDEQSQRDLAIIKLILLTGLRTHEVIKANVGNIRQFGGQAVLFILGKGRSEKDELVVLKLY